MNENARLRKALENLVLAAGEASEAAAALSNEVLACRKGLLPEATLTREGATLLLHLSQQLGRTVQHRLGNQATNVEAHPEN